MDFSGELGFIEMLRGSFADIGDGGIVGIGDDCAVLPLTEGESLVVTTDMLNEEVHFLREATSARELGAKALAVNLSDVAAMGARPVASFLSLALPRACRGEWLAEFMDGYREMSQRYGVRLAGGDTTASKSGVVINVTVIGRAPNAHIKYRGAARPGDIVAVNGMLGESAAGLADILNSDYATDPAGIHRNPVPQVAEGEWLGGRGEVRAMIDLSDGLATDLRHILEMSDAAARVEIAAIPTVFSVEQAVTGGEDYKLLFTVDPEGFEKLNEDYTARFDSGLHALGMIVAGEPGITWMENGLPVERDWEGFTHF